MLNRFSFGLFGNKKPEDNGKAPLDARGRGGPFNGSGQVMTQRTEQILSSGINRGMGGTGGGGSAIVNAPVNTVNNSQSNMTNTSTPMFHPSPLLGAVIASI